MVNSIIEYKKFENRIIEDLKNEISKNKEDIGYLVDINWINEYKQFTHFDEINFSPNNSDIIKQLLIYYQEGKMKKLREIQLFQFQKPEEIKNKNLSIVLINNSFYHLVAKKELDDKYKIKYTCSNGIVTIYINNNPINFNSNNNIIKSIYNENEDNFEVLEY